MKRYPPYSLLAFFWLIVILITISRPVYSIDYGMANCEIDAKTNSFLWESSSRHGVQLPSSMMVQPLRINDIVQFLDTLDSLGAKGELSKRELWEIERIRTHAIGRTNKLSFASSKYDVIVRPNLSLYGDVSAYTRSDFALAGKGILHPQLSGRVGWLSFFSSADVLTEFKTDTLYPASDYQPYKGVPYNLYGRADSSQVRSSDMFRGGVAVVLGNIELETAVDRIRTGPAVYFPLTFSGDAPPIVYARTRINLGLFTYSHLVGQLKAEKDKAKFVYFHRLQYPLFNGKLQLGYNEVVINGSSTDFAQNDSVRNEFKGQTRSLEWAYCIPFIPFKFAEHYLGDRDNGLISFDGMLMFPQGFRWYGEFLLDDMSSPFTLFTNDWGNKWAFTVGMQWAGSLCLRDTRFGFEYARVEPWVYSHFSGGSHNYVHFGENLGASIGPDADVLTASAGIALVPSQTITITATGIRQNKNARGGSVDQVFQENIDSPRKTFLDTGYTRKGRLEAMWEYGPYGLFTIDLGVFIQSDNVAGVRMQGGFSF
jgi:hypothetical protein